MAIRKFQNKALRPDVKVTDRKKSAIIETKRSYCFPQYGKTVMAKNQKEADRLIKKIIK